MKTEKSLRARAMDYVARRELSRAQLHKKLQPYAEDEDELERVLNEFAKKNWQSDERFTQAFVRSKSTKHGSARLQQELKAHGVSADLIRDALPSREEELRNAISVARKKFKQPAQNFEEKQKQMRFLLYRGFSSGIAQAAFKADWDEEEPWDSEG